VKESLEEGAGDREALRRGTVRLLVLKALEDRPRHGYGVMQEISRLFAGRYVPSPGGVYPTLQLLVDQGLVRSEAGPERTEYRLTDAGREELRVRHHTVARLLAAGSGPDEARAFPLRTAAIRLARTVRRYAREMTPVQRRTAARILDTARAGIVELMEPT